MSDYRSAQEESATYKGSKTLSVYKSSEEVFEYSCDPCNIAGDHVDAQGFCIDCKDYLCGNCFRSHSRSKASRHHTLLDRDNMPTKSVPLCDLCKLEGDEKEAAGYCTNCKEYLCEHCYKSHSRNKTSMEHILLDKDNMPRSNTIEIENAASTIKISEHCVGSEEYTEEYTEEYSFIQDINVKMDDDENDCYINYMTLVSSTELILADCDNKSLKLVDVESDVIKHALKLQAVPLGLTTISKDQVAVVLNNQSKIQIVSVSRGLSISRTLKTDGNCVCIKHINGKLYVSFWKPVKFQILNLTGAIKKTIKPDTEVLKHCTLPRYIAVSHDESMIYISDLENNKVLSMDMNGNMITMYQDELDKPRDITVSPSGSVYLCNRDKHVVYKMTSDLNDVTVILVSGDGLASPCAMCFNTDKKHLYISSASAEAKYCNFIKVFRWS